MPEASAEAVVTGGREAVPEEVAFMKPVTGNVSVVESGLGVVEGEGAVVESVVGEKVLVGGVVREAEVSEGREEGFDFADVVELLKVMERDDVLEEGVEGTRAAEGGVPGTVPAEGRVSGTGAAEGGVSGTGVAGKGPGGTGVAGEAGAVGGVAMDDVTGPETAGAAGVVVGRAAGGPTGSVEGRTFPHARPGRMGEINQLQPGKNSSGLFCCEPRELR